MAHNYSPDRIVMSHKYCPGCKENKTIDSFSINSSRKDGLQNKCKICRQTYMKSWYQDNSITQKSRSKSSKEFWYKEYRNRIIAYLEEHPCIDCGNNDIEVLEFDHKDQQLKMFNIGEALSHGYGWPKIQNEIEKCDVRCANCHRKKTRKQLGWWIM
jgi:hypothetical protein